MAKSSKLERALGSMEHAITIAEENNKRKREMEIDLEKIQVTVEKSSKLLHLLNTLIKNLTIYSANYRNRRRSELEEDTKSVLKLVFPDENYDVKIDWDESRGKPQAQILTGLKTADGSIEWCPPKNVHGEFSKQLIAYTTLCNMAVMLGAKVFCSDEALNSGDDESLASTKPLLDKLNEVLQLIVIEHKQNFYRDVDRREIALEKIPGDDGEHSGYVQIVNTQEFISREE